MPARRKALGRILPLAAALAVVCVAAPSSAQNLTKQGGGTDELVFVGSNWDGSVSVLNPADDFAEVGRVNMIPDHDERMLEIATNPVDLAFFLAIRQLIGEGHDQFVDDMYTTPDGSLLIASRPSFKDVVALDIDDCEDLNACEIAWRFEVAGNRSDHMAISPDGSQVAISASTGNVVHILDSETGQEVDQFPSGDSPHESNYSEDGERLYHASIGRVYTPNQEGNPILDSTKGSRVFRVVDTDDYEIVDDINIRQELNEAGFNNISAAVRPMAIAPNERKAYIQLSFFHGFMVYSFKKDKILRRVDLPNLVPDLPPEQYLLNSAQHGLAINGNGNKLCVAGTMSDYAAVVNRRSIRRPEGPKFKLLEKGLKPYWSTTSANGKNCYVSWSGSDSISVISYGKRKEIHHVPVGDHPQRVRTGYLPEGWIEAHSG